MSKTYNLTPKEMQAALAFVDSCLRGMGGERPSDLESDEYTWISANDLVEQSWNKHEAAGLMSALSEKGFISEYEPGQWIVETSAWRWIDTVWDQYNQSDEDRVDDLAHQADTESMYGRD